MRFSIASLTALCASFTVAIPVATRNTGSPYKRLVVFGDSFSDNGNGSWVASNQTWPVDPAYYNRSFSNGPKWNDVLAQNLGLELINLATGGATADNSFVAGGTGADSTIAVPSATEQLESFLSWDAPRPEDIFVHWIGANDILFNTSITGAQITSLINANVDKLYRAGAKTVIVANYPSLSHIPATYNVADYTSAGPFTDSLTVGLGNVVAGWSAYMSTALVDVGALFAAIVADPEAYGVDPRYVNPPTQCLKGVYASEGVPRSLCADPERHVFLDGYHPVKEIHARVGKLFEEAIDGFAEHA